jgi:hypothetical protein
MPGLCCCSLPLLLHLPVHGQTSLGPEGFKRAPGILSISGDRVFLSVVLQAATQGGLGSRYRDASQGPVDRRVLGPLPQSMHSRCGAATANHCTGNARTRTHKRVPTRPSARAHPTSPCTSPQPHLSAVVPHQLHICQHLACVPVGLPLARQPVADGGQGHRAADDLVVSRRVTLLHWRPEPAALPVLLQLVQDLQADREGGGRGTAEGRTRVGRASNWGQTAARLVARGGRAVKS